MSSPLASVFSIALPIAGVTMLGIGIGHIYIAKLLNWKEELKTLSHVNESVFYAHATFVVAVLMSFGIALVVAPSVLITRSAPAMILSGCFALCWLSRLAFQLITLREKIHNDGRIDFAWRILGTLLWIFYAVLFSVLFVYQCGFLGD